jgi:hypothetical protein
MSHVKLVWGSTNDLVLQDLASGGIDGDRYHRAAYRSPEMAKYTSTVMAIDPSGRGKDETAYSILKYAHGMLFLVDNGGFIDGFGEKTLETLAGKAARWGVNNLIIEENYGGGMFNQLLLPYLIRLKAGTIDNDWNAWSSGQKELRILDTLEPIFQNHRLVVSRAVIEADLKQQHENPRYSLVQQITRMSRTKGSLVNEDRLESLSMACAYFTEKMARDQNRVLEQHKASLIDKELKTYMAHVMGQKRPKGLRWS